MKGKIQKIIIAVMIAALLIVTFCRPIETHAMTDTRASKIVDIALTKTGIVANKSILNSVSGMLENVIKDTLQLYDDWLDEYPEKEISVETFNEFIDGGGLSTFAYKAIEPYINRNFVKTVVTEYRNNIDNAKFDIMDAIIGETSILGKIISLPSGLINFIRSLFDEYATDNETFYYLDTYSPQDAKPAWFLTAEAYQQFCYALNNYEEYLYIEFKDGDSKFNFNNDTYAYYFRMYRLGEDVLYMHQDPSSTQNNALRLYNTSWESPVVTYKQVGTDIDCNNISNIESFYDVLTTESTLSQVVDSFGKKQTVSPYYCGGGIWTKDGRPIKVYRTLTALKNDTVGQSPYYVTNNALSYEKTDNSVDISGDFIESANYQYSHDIVQTEINNNETVDNSVVNNVVNNSSSTIINNYYASTESNGNGNNDNGGGGISSILGGLGSIISAAAEIVGFLLGVIGDVIGLIGDLFKVVFEGIKALGSLVGDFPKLLGELFVFIPQELIDFLVLSVEASIGIAIWRKFSK